MNFNYTVIIPFRNFDEMLVKACASIPLREDIQVIIVDNGVEPVGKSCLDRLNNPQIMYLTSSPTKGAGCARNVGLEKAKGKYLLFLDADDYFLDSAFDSFDKELDSGCDIIYFNATSIRLSDGAISQRHLGIDTLIKRSLNSQDYDCLRYQFINPVCKMISRKLVAYRNIKFQEVPAGNDQMFSTWTGHYAHEIKAVDKIVYVITEGESNTSLTTTKSLKNQRSRFEVALCHYQFVRSVGKKKMAFNILGFIKMCVIDFGVFEALKWCCVAVKRGYKF